MLNLQEREQQFRLQDLAIDEQGFLGLFTGGFTSCAVGVSAALIFGFIASLIFEPRMKKE